MPHPSLYSIVVAMLLTLLQGCAGTGSAPDLDSLAFKRTSLQRSAVELNRDEAREYARWAVPFSRVASHVYCKYLSGNDPENKELEDCKKFPELQETGWMLLYDWQSILTQEDRKTDLEFMAFGRAEPGRRGEIVIGFKGTNFSSPSDWRSNLRWFTRILPLPGRDEFFYPLSDNINEVSFDLVHARGNPVSNHSMTAFRGGLVARADVKPTTPVPIAALPGSTDRFNALPGKPDCTCYRKRRPQDRSSEAAVCRASTVVEARPFDSVTSGMADDAQAKAPRERSRDRAAGD